MQKHIHELKRHALQLEASIAQTSGKALTHLYEIVDGFQVEEVVVWDVDAYAEVESGVPSVDDFEVAELDEVCVFGVPDGH